MERSIPLIGSLLLLATAIDYRSIDCAKISVGLENDLSRPTLGLHGPTSSSISYDEKNGLSMKGVVNDVLGPPIRIVNGFNDVISGSSMASAGNSLKSDGAGILGFDTHFLESFGGGNLLRGGILNSGTNFGVKGGQIAPEALSYSPGKKISSIIELPVKIVALKEMAAKKALNSLEEAKKAEKMSLKFKGENMVKEGEALKSKGMNEMMKAANEGLQSINSMVQQTTNNAATAIKLLPIILDLPVGDQPEQVQPKQAADQQTKAGQRQSLTGESLFGGIPSLLDQHQYAAMLHPSNPITNLLMNLNPSHNFNSLLYPYSSSHTKGKHSGNAQTTTFNFIPGFKMTETISSQPSPLLAPLFPEAQQQQQQESIKV